VLTATKARPTRHQARLLIYPAAVAAVVVAGGATWAGGHNSSGASTTPATVTVAAAATTVTPCTTADLEVSTQPSTFGMNSVGQIFSVTNTGSSECAVPDQATDIHGQDADGTDVAINDVATMDRLPGTTSGSLAPGGTATFALVEGDTSMCSASTTVETATAISLAFGPDATLTVTLPSTDAVTLGCGGVGLTQVGVSPIGSSANAAAAATGAVVEASRTLPSQVAAGSAMSYTVTLTNNSSSAVSLSPCPSYVAYIALTPGQVAANEVAGSLDCGTHSSIPAGGSVAFDLSINAPTQTGLTKVGWWLTGAAFSAQTGGAVTVIQ